MENHDKIYDQFKEASQKAETKDFPSMDKVWNRVEEKLETKVLAKKSNLWKKIAVAATIVATVSIGYQFLKSENEIIIPENEITTIEAPTRGAAELSGAKTSASESISTENAVVSTEEIPSNSKKEAATVLKKQIENKAEAIVATEMEKNKQADEESEASKTAWANNSGFYSNSGFINNNQGYELKGKVFDAIGVHHTTEQYTIADTVKSKIVQMAKKTPPLVVIDGKPITNEKKSGTKTLEELDRDDIESVVTLKEPLYIINGVQYSEEELFGKKPTSPYAPLDKQEITTLIILQDEEAIQKYGEKGEKGVVIITTKTGKPAKILQKN